MEERLGWFAACRACVPRVEEEIGDKFELGFGYSMAKWWEIWRCDRCKRLKWAKRLTEVYPFPLGFSENLEKELAEAVPWGDL